MICARVRRLLSAYLDAELPAERRSAVRRHLQSCGACRSRLDGFKNLANVTELWAEVQPAASLWRRLAPKISSACETAVAEAITFATEQNQKLSGPRRTFKPSFEGLEDRYALAGLLGAPAAVVAPAAFSVSVALERVDQGSALDFGAATASVATAGFDFGAASLLG